MYAKRFNSGRSVIAGAGARRFGTALAATIGRSTA
jgi:hypothetical protein